MDECECPACRGSDLDEPRPSGEGEVWRVFASVTNSGVWSRWHAVGPWRDSEEEARRDAEHGSLRGALPEPADYLHQPMPACVPGNSMPDAVRETIASRFRGYKLYEYPPEHPQGWRWTYRAKSVSRCNAPEPAATVPRSEVEALRDEARQQRDDWERRLELIGADHAARSAALARYRVWGCVHEDLEALLAKSGGAK